MTRRRVQPTFRLALSVALVGLVLLAVPTIGWISLSFGRESATDLSQKVLQQTLHRVDLRVRDFLRVAVRQSRLSERLLRGERLEAADFEKVTLQFAQAMAVYERLTNLGIGLEATGEFCMVARKGGVLTSVNYLRETDGRMRIDLYEPRTDGRRLIGHKDFDGYDPRRRPFYVGVVEAGAPAWTDAYLFFGAGGRQRVPGVTYGTPLRAPDGSLLGVMHADFDLFALCHFLDALREEVPGFAFVVERRADGSRRAIAHPDPGTLLRRATSPDGQETHALAETADEMGDPRVRAFLARLPDHDVAAAAAAGTSRTLDVRSEGEDYFAGYRLLRGADAPRWAVCMMVPRAKILEVVERNNRTTLYIGLAALAVAIVASIVIANRIATPLARIAAQSEQIGQFELDAPALGRSGVTELDRLMLATEEMKASLRSFERYVPARLVREMSQSGVEAELGGESRTLTVYFSHIADFEALRVRVPVRELVEQLGAYFAEIAEEIETTWNGTLDKYMGDAVMAFWGAPHALEDHALCACRAALGGVRRLEALRRRWGEEGRQAFDVSIGLNTGELVVGNMGSPSRLSYTVIGDAVNVAARLEGLNKVYGTRILLGERTYAEVAERVIARQIDRVAVKGKRQGVAVYELLGLEEDGESAFEALVRDYETALEAYFARRWSEAAAGFEGVLAAHPEDGPSRLLLRRCQELEADPPDEDWDGVHVMTRK